MYFRKKTSGGRAYLQIVESRRDGGQVRQQVIATLGRYEDLRESGQLERLLRSGARFSGKAMVVDAVHDGSGDDGIGAAAWASSGIRAFMGRDRLPRRDRRTRRKAQARVRTRTCGLPHRAASPVRGRVRSGGGPLARGLPDRRRRGARPASPLSGDGVAG